MLDRALDALHDDPPSFEKWHLCKQMASALALQHTTPTTSTTLQIASANVSSWRPEVRDWAFSLKAHGILLQELHLTASGNHEGSVATGSSPALLSSVTSRDPWEVSGSFFAPI